MTLRRKRAGAPTCAECKALRAHIMELEAVIEALMSKLEPQPTREPLQ